MSGTSPLPRRIAVKFFAERAAPAGSSAASDSADSADASDLADRAAEIPLEPFIQLFHKFIQEQTLLGLLVDVADYAHVPLGPGVILIGHDVDYGFDSTGGKTGLLTTRKHYADDGRSISDVLRDTLGKAVVAIRAIEEDGSAAVKFDTSRVEVQILDRLSVKGEGALESLSAEIAPLLHEVFEKVDTAVATGDARRPPTLVIQAQQATAAAVLCDRLAVVMPEPQRESVFEIAVTRLKQLRDDGSDFLLIDVREPDEFEICNLGGQLIPLGTLPDRIPELDKSAHVIVHCKGGGRGAEATAALRRAGFENAWNLKGGILAWIDEVDPELSRY